MPRLIGVIPTELLDKGKLDDVLLLLARLPIDPEDRKQILVQWCQYVGAALTRDMVERANAESA